MAFSAFPNLPGDIGSVIRTRQGGGGEAMFVAGQGIKVKGLAEFLRKCDRMSPEFSRELRKAAYAIAKDLSVKVLIEAGTVSRSRQAVAVAKGLRAKNDRYPTISLRGQSPFPSKSRPPRKRNRPVTRADVFFGAEFGGGASSRTDQFLRHRHQSGYFFWPTVRKNKNSIAKEYLEAIDRIVKTLGID